MKILLLLLIVTFLCSYCSVSTNASMNGNSTIRPPNYTDPTTTTAAPNPPLTSTTTSTAPSHHVDFEDWRSIVNKWEFFSGIQRIAFSMCYDEFYGSCEPALRANDTWLQDRWDEEDFRCTPKYCDCYDGQVIRRGNDTICVLPPITQGWIQLCHEVEVCSPIRERCADNFVYIQGKLPRACDTFINCTLQPNVITAATIQCSDDRSRCDTTLACQVANDPLDKLPPPTTLNPLNWDNTLPQAIRDIWIVTATIFGVVLCVAVIAIVLMRHRQRQWERQWEEANEMSTERADDVVWFEPERESRPSLPPQQQQQNNNNNDDDPSSSPTDPSSSAPPPRPPKDTSCVRCGSPNALLQLLPCRCRWCGCAEPDTYSPPRISTSTTTTTGNLQEEQERLMSETNATSSPREGAGGETESVQVSALSCRGVPIFSGKIPKSVVELHQQQLRQREEEERQEREAGVEATNRTRDQASRARTLRAPRPKCNRCNCSVNFVINFNKLYYPAASQEVSEEGGDEQAPKTENTENEKSETEQQDKNEETQQQEQSSSLSASALATVPSRETEKQKAKRKMKIPTCCICLSEPCSVAIIPCGHVAQCVGCAKKLCIPIARQDTERRAFVISSKCPLCREQIVAMASLSKAQNQRAFEQSASFAGEE